MARMPTPPRPSGTTAPSRLKWGAAILLLIVAGYAVWKLPTWRAMAQTGAAYGARMGCSCRFVEGRAIGSCATDLEPGMEAVSLSENAEAKSVTARVPLLASRTARFVAGTGCMLEE
jgi:membrane protein DedA with SNARE-associated domain